MRKLHLSGTRLPGVAVIVVLAAGVIQGRAWSATGATGTDVALSVKRMTPPSAATAATAASGKAQYICTARVQTLDGSVLSEARIQAAEGLQAQATTGTDSGDKVSLQVLVVSPTEVRYEVRVTRKDGTTDVHRSRVQLAE